ncbi:MAG TPA: hypothetical protein PK852_02670 [Mesotoga prima]|uniref:hypothetical protein n=1 Tax=Mesotoga prima TaxID=1184387 RepID=UPI002B563FDF|nr:hypothetical protein [Mesotoga prima]HPE52999.1 hypothetical protein [Mesotoga prima]
MTQPLRPGKRPGRSELSHGDGRFPHPESDYQSQRRLPWGVEPGKGDASLTYASQKRLDATNPEENIEDMPYELGNPDGFGPGPKLVKEKKQSPPYVYKQPKYTYGVNRQE